MTNNTYWRKSLYWLRVNFPLENKISVKCKNKLSSDDPNDAGVCIQFDDNSVKIEINKKQCFDLKIDALIHEWAHALTFDSKNIDDHGDDWGKMYSRIYRKFVKWNFGEKTE